MAGGSPHGLGIATLASVFDHSGLPSPARQGPCSKSDAGSCEQHTSPTWNGTTELGLRCLETAQCRRPTANAACRLLVDGYRAAYLAPDALRELQTLCGVCQSLAFFDKFDDTGDGNQLSWPTITGDTDGREYKLCILGRNGR